MIESQGTPFVPYFEAPTHRNVGGGKSFYVAQAARGGSDSNEGTDPQYPLLKIATAIALCTQRKHDYVWVQDSYQDDTFPISLATRNMHVIGLGEGHSRPSRAYLDSDTEACFRFDTNGHGIELAGFEMGATGGADPCILIEAAVMKGHIHHCGFGLMVAQDGITYTFHGTEDFYLGMIDHCYFGRYLNRDGIRLCAIGRGAINNNHFEKMVGIGIHIHDTGGGHVGEGGPILGNTFHLIQDSALGAAITLDESTQGGFVVDQNHAMQDGANPGNNPYLDKTNAALGSLANAWGLNYSGIVATYPSPLV